MRMRAVTVLVLQVVIGQVSDASGAFLITERGLFFASFPSGASIMPVQTTPPISLDLASRVAVDATSQLAVAANAVGVHSLSCYVRMLAARPHVL